VRVFVEIDETDSMEKTMSIVSIVYGWWMHSFVLLIDTKKDSCESHHWNAELYKNG